MCTACCGPFCTKKKHLQPHMCPTASLVLAGWRDGTSSPHSDLRESARQTEAALQVNKARGSTAHAALRLGLLWEFFRRTYTGMAFGTCSEERCQTQRPWHQKANGRSRWTAAREVQLRRTAGTSARCGLASVPDKFLLSICPPPKVQLLATFLHPACSLHGPGKLAPCGPAGKTMRGHQISFVQLSLILIMSLRPTDSAALLCSAPALDLETSPSRHEPTPQANGTLTKPRIVRFLPPPYDWSCTAESLGRRIPVCAERGLLYKWLQPDQFWKLHQEIRTWRVAWTL